MEDELSELSRAIISRCLRAGAPQPLQDADLIAYLAGAIDSSQRPVFEAKLARDEVARKKLPALLKEVQALSSMPLSQLEQEGRSADGTANSWLQLLRLQAASKLSQASAALAEIGRQMQLAVRTQAPAVARGTNDPILSETLKHLGITLSGAVDQTGVLDVDVTCSSGELPSTTVTLFLNVLDQRVELGTAMLTPKMIFRYEDFSRSFGVDTGVVPSFLFELRTADETDAPASMQKFATVEDERLAAIPFKLLHESAPTYSAGTLNLQVTLDDTLLSTFRSHLLSVEVLLGPCTSQFLADFPLVDWKNDVKRVEVDSRVFSQFDNNIFAVLSYRVRHSSTSTRTM